MSVFLHMLIVQISTTHLVFIRDDPIWLFIFLQPDVLFLLNQSKPLEASKGHTLVCTKAALNMCFIIRGLV